MDLTRHFQDHFLHIDSIQKHVKRMKKGHENHSLCQINNGMLHSHKHKLQIGKASHHSARHLPTNYRQIAYK